MLQWWPLNFAVTTMCTLIHIYTVFSEHTYQLSHINQEKTGGLKNTNLIELWFSAQSLFTLVCCQYDFSFMRWLFAGKHFLINYTVQSTIHTIRAHTYTHSVVRTWWVSTVHCTVAATGRLSFPFIPIFCSFCILNTRSIHFSQREQKTCLCVVVRHCFDGCSCFAIVGIWAHDIYHSMCLCDGAHINNPSLKIRQQVLSSM